MLEDNNMLGLTPAGNRRHPSRKNALDWIKKRWDSLKPSCILNAVDKCYMSPDPSQSLKAIRKTISPKESERTRKNFKNAIFLNELPRKFQQVFVKTTNISFFSKYQKLLTKKNFENFSVK